MNRKTFNKETDRIIKSTLARVTGKKPRSTKRRTKMTKRKALALYAETIKDSGLEAGEQLVKKYSKMFPDYEKLAKAASIMLRACTLLDKARAAKEQPISISKPSVQPGDLIGDPKIPFNNDFPEVSLTVLARDFHKILKKVEQGACYFITRRGKRVAVIIPA